jgi:DNA repair exonuclease SbcCD ATPase subunit
MRNRFIRQGALLLSLCMLIGMCLIDAGAQSRRRRRTRRARRPVAVRPVVTNPAIAAPGEEQEAIGPDGERIISTADQGTSETEQAAEATPPKKSKTATKTGGDADMQQTINQLSNQVDRLNDKLTQMQQNDRTLIDMERLTRAEQRAESLRSQQLDVESKLADAQSKLEQVEYQMRPENIDRASGYGTVHPEEAREARRRQLENERSRIQAQVKILETSRTRLETSLVTADLEVDTLRRKIELQQAQQDNSGTATSEPRQTRRPKPE